MYNSTLDLIQKAQKWCKMHNSKEIVWLKKSLFILVVTRFEAIKDIVEQTKEIVGVVDSGR